MSLYTDLVAIGANISNHESDLYVEASLEVRAVLRRWPNQARNATFFKSQIDGKICIDVPFAYDPFWEARRPKETGHAT